MFNHLRFHWHVRKLLAGSAQPGRFRLLSADLKAIRKKGIRTIISLDEGLKDIPPEFSRDMSFHSEPIVDGCAPTVTQMERIRRVVKREMSRGRPCLICCLGGVGRTATVLAALMMEPGVVGMSMEQALEELRAKGRTPMSMDQVRFLKKWQERASRRRLPRR